VGIPLSSQGQVTLSLQEQPGAIEISIDCERGSAGPAALGEKENANLAIARELALLNHGTFDSHLAGQTLRVRLTLPVSKPVVVLAIDDNADMLQLYQRYAQGTRYTIIGIQNPAEALEVATRLFPQIILMDVMMPEIDGWDLLMRLREDPRTSFVPIVICTILPQEGLAHSLGANAFLQKPVLPQAFLSVLDRQMEVWR
jgi:CheY-like chemotaxis protein